MDLEELLKKTRLENGEVVIPLDVFEELLEEIFRSPEQEAEDLLEDPDIRRAIEKFKKGETKFYSLEEAERKLGLK